jgi:hypothetical protein
MLNRAKCVIKDFKDLPKILEEARCKLESEKKPAFHENRMNRALVNH